VSAARAVDAEVRLYDNLFMKEDPSEVEEGQDVTSNLNPNSLEVLTGCKVEPGLRDAPAGSRYQFERLGYFCVDTDSESGKLVFNRTIGLRDTWSKIERRDKK
jgi:glutaminyl-tRNA synthetase